MEKIDWTKCPCDNCSEYDDIEGNKLCHTTCQKWKDYLISEGILHDDNTYYLEDIIHERVFGEQPKTHDVYVKFLIDKLFDEKERIIKGQEDIIKFLLEKLKSLVSEDEYQSICFYCDEIDYESKKEDFDFIINKIKEWEKKNYGSITKEVCQMSKMASR